MDVMLRDWQRSDAQGLYVLCLDKSLREEWDSSFLYPKNEKKAQACIDLYVRANPVRFCTKAIVYKNQLCGFIQCAITGHECAEISYWLGSEFRAQGVMKQAVHLMCQQSFQTLPIFTIYARVSMNCIASQRVLLANDFYESKETAPIYMYFKHRLASS